MDAVVYNRVSSGRQETIHQLPECEALCRQRGWSFEVVEETGKRTKRDRPGWAHVLELARKRRVRAVVVWSLDRIGGLYSILDTVRELDRIGVALISIRESWVELGTGDPMYRDLLVRLLDWCAGMELRRLADRTAAAHATARSRGKPIGRPRVLAGTPLQRAIALRKEKPPKSWEEIRKVLKRDFEKNLKRSTIASAVTRTLEEMENAAE